MTTTAVERTTTIDLGHGCECGSTMPAELFAQLHRRYAWPASTVELPDDFDAYLVEHRTARKRAARARARGYVFREIDRSRHVDEIFAINTSAESRQGRPMSDGYRERPQFGPNPTLCLRHHVYAYGSFFSDEKKLAAYLWLYRCGELALVSSILGHADKLRDEVMYLLLAETIRDQANLGGTLFYNLHTSGTDGLRFFKERFGLAPTRVEFRL